MGEVCKLIILSTALVHLESTVEQFESVRMLVWNPVNPFLKSFYGQFPSVDITHWALVEHMAFVLSLSPSW